MNSKPVIVWFRNDLRMRDNPALAAAHSSGAPLIPLYILEELSDHPIGGAGKWWLHHSLTALGEDIALAGSQLILKAGRADNVLKELIEQTGAQAVFWNRRYDLQGIELDKKIKAALSKHDIETHSFNGSLLREPWEIKTLNNGHYKVFTPFWKNLRALGPNRSALAKRPSRLRMPEEIPESETLKDWALLPTDPDWAHNFPAHWHPGEKGAHKNLKNFFKKAVNTYNEDRNRPDIVGTSRLSPHLAFGEISPNQIWQKTHEKIACDNEGIDEGQAVKFLSEVGWREFSYHLLYFYPQLSTVSLKENFRSYPWRDDPEGLVAWQKGQTGYPMVDAGMRELWQTGWMHNRVRMIVASFLIKHLLIPWQEGEKWFWDTLVDADIANNSASWQWVAGCGADAAPYFRIFNPFGQGEKFDTQGDYVRTYVPELSKLPTKYIHQPWSAPKDVLEQAGIRLGIDYPEPIVDHKLARDRALAGYNQIKGVKA